MKIVHIFNDFKFIDEAQRKYEEGFLNTFVYINSSKSTIIPEYPEVINYSTSRKHQNEIIDICNKADIIILYSLDWQKIRILRRLKQDAIVMWRFFGFEIYNYKKKQFFSRKTVQIYNSTRFSKKNIINSLKFYHIRCFCRFWIMQHSYKKINYILLICKEEYSLLRTISKDLPKCIVLPLSPKKTIPIQVNVSNKKRKIIIGNSRSYFNNHSDILEITSKYTNRGYGFIIPFNYGLNTGYAEIIRNQINQMKNHQLLDTFMSYEEYSRLFEDSSAFVLNSIRQLGLGNIFIAIKNGVKIYINESNVIFTWLRRNNVEIYPVSDLEKDLENNNIILSNSIANKNIEALRMIYLQNPNEVYFDILHTLVKK
ncbi:MAG: TDP-N-acetylfucosamine:lipid II N-acetylfucosaminyltransferase [Bacteroidales bacterium]|nr:TDP-N-acetylfucosamine:lipid II N-acetylfucosaminyltransferase [Bacteroidales bacterium]MDD3962308.1 TDP-N-acetylfucosamine:lipid II N-acetylfucosaminyltransferase [Bacteroidales bacterium]MDY0286580.1 TDP-N-acetylfucosamine:lipid II N-acetylfucosaminyltransferase [Bacteroidales bacterium]